MKTLEKRFLDLGTAIPGILLPGPGIDMQKWAVIACDQFTQDRMYWEKVKNAAAGAPSALNLVFPEIFLSGDDKKERINRIHRTMEEYLAKGIFAPPRRGCVYLERTTPFNKNRQGLVIAFDLERYEWEGEARSLIRATEGTMPERLLPRMDIRRNAPLETPHILILINDESGGLFSGLAGRVKNAGPVYDSLLMLNSGEISGWFVDQEDDLAFIASGLEALAEKSRSLPGGEPFLFAMGDGNHSLATAKAVWDEYKSRTGAEDHPLRYALAEIENIYDPAIQFEPIHRVIFGMGFDEAKKTLSELSGFSCRILDSREELVRLVNEEAEKTRFGIVAHNRYALAETDERGIATACIQPLLDRRLAERGDSLSSDYIHGGDELFRVSEGTEKLALGILLPPVKKAGLFETVARTGPLPRKSFSMGEAEEKRFYLECRKL